MRAVKPDEPLASVEARQRVESELGDILFVVANIARRWGINPEEALRHSNRKFLARVQFIEAELAKTGRRLADASFAGTGNDLSASQTDGTRRSVKRALPRECLHVANAYTLLTPTRFLTPRPAHCGNGRDRFTRWRPIC